MIKDSNCRITITLSKEDMDYLDSYAELLDMNTSRLISRLVHVYVVSELTIHDKKLQR